MTEKSEQELRLDWAIFGRPCAGERVSGDAAIVEERDGMLFLGIIDVLGHGAEAHALVERIEESLRRGWSRDVVGSLRRLHEVLKGTRGAAAGVAALEVASGELRYAGVGNTAIRKFGARPARLLSVEGIVGSHMRTPVEQTLHLGRSDVVVLQTDGLSNNFERAEYPQIVCHRARAIARTLVRRFGQVYDDATCIVVRYAR